VSNLPNIKSAKKRVLVNAKKTEQNKMIRSAVKTEMKKVDAFIKENKLEEAKAALSVAFSVIDSACAKNVYHANNAANKKAKLAKRVDAAVKAAAPVVEEVVAPVVEKPKPVKSENKFNLPKAKNGATLVFVFDDGGQKVSDLKEFLKLPFPITVAVLPKLQYSVESANLVRQSGNELILHQPMQAINRSVNPGPGAIKPEMSEDEVRSLLFSNINEIGPVAGMNNHEGSAITADIEKMAVVLKTASDCGIFFLDSRTNVNTVVPLVAKEMGYNYYERNIFLDNEKTRENALMELKKGLDIANKKGSAIMIGHVWSADFLPALLKELYPELVKNGYKFSVVSES
jgi:ribosomal protein S20